MYKTLSKHLQHGEGKVRSLSPKTVAYEKRKNDKFATIASAHKGKIVQAKIVKIVNYGVFVDVNGVGGFVHISEIAKSKISDIHNELKIGTVHEFKIIEVGLNKKGLLSLRLTQILDKPMRKEERITSDPSKFSNTPFSDLGHLISKETDSTHDKHILQEETLSDDLHDSHSSTYDEYEDIKI